MNLANLEARRSSDGETAPGAPGTPGRWHVADKASVGTALGSPSGMWFTLRQGIVTEVDPQSSC
jgi:hypothetical protein